MITSAVSLITRVNGITSGLFAAPAAVSVIRAVYTFGVPAAIIEGTMLTVKLPGVVPLVVLTLKYPAPVIVSVVIV